jgi:hypothetical protein
LATLSRIVAARSPETTGDWGVLLRAVQARLRIVVRDAPGSRSAAPADDATSHIQAQVLECVHALDALHAAWAEETDRCRRLQSERRTLDPVGHQCSICTAASSAYDCA